MSALVTLSPATAPDFPTLAHIAAVATAVNLIHRVLNPSADIFDTSRQEGNIVAKLQGHAANPEARIVKASLQDSGEIVGYAVFRFDDRGEAVSGATTEKGGATTVNPPPPVGTDLVGRLTGALNAAHGKHMAGKRHVFWMGLMVLPAHQRKGIGSAMLQHGLDELGANEVPIWLVTQMNGHELYRKFGFEAMELVDLDLSEFTGPHRGFGVYRSLCMMRQPRGVPSSGLGTE